MPAALLQTATERSKGNLFGSRHYPEAGAVEI